jgi:hypothetical protein
VFSLTAVIYSFTLDSQLFFEASAVERIWRRCSVQRWTFCDVSHVEEGPYRWKRYYSARAALDVKMDEGRPKFDYKVIRIVCAKL